MASPLNSYVVKGYQSVLWDVTDDRSGGIEGGRYHPDIVQTLDSHRQFFDHRNKRVTQLEYT